LRFPLQALLLDRDGVLNLDRPDSVRRADTLIPLPGALNALARLRALGLPLVVVSNQACIGRGWVSEQEQARIHTKTMDWLDPQRSGAAHLLICPHPPEARCDCRKPKPGLLRQALEIGGWAPDRVLMVGDAPRDLEAAKALGIAAVLVRTGKGRGSEIKLAMNDLPIFDDLAQVVEAVTAWSRMEAVDQHDA